MTRRFLFIEVDFILNHRRGSGRKGEARMRSGRKGEERRECILNSTPLESCFVFCFSLFEKSEEEREGNLF